MNSTINEQEIITSLRSETMKQHRVLDGQGRVVTIYEAHTNAKSGDACLKTSRAYHLATNIEIGMKEEIAQWDTSWELGWGF